MIVSKNVNYNKCAPKLVFFIEKKIEKSLNDFWHRILHPKLKIYVKFFFGDVDSLAKIFQILYPPSEIYIYNFAPHLKTPQPLLP